MKTLLVAEHDDPLGPLPTEAGIWGSWVAVREANAADLAEGLFGSGSESILQRCADAMEYEDEVTDKAWKGLQDAARRVCEMSKEVNREQDAPVAPRA